MVVVEYKLSLVDDFHIGDTIMITNKTGSGWRALINNKHEINFEVNHNNNYNNNTSGNNDSIPLLLDGWILVDVNDRWEKLWVCCKEGPFQVGFFKNEQEKMEKMKKSDQGSSSPSCYLESLREIDELEVVQATNPHNPPIISLQRFVFKTSSRSYSLIIPTKDGMVATTRAIMKALRNKERSLPKPATPTPVVAPSLQSPPPPSLPVASTPPSKPMQIPASSGHHHQQQQQQQQQQHSNQALSRSAPHTTAHHPHTHAQTHAHSHEQPPQHSRNQSHSSASNQLPVLVLPPREHSRDRDRDPQAQTHVQHSTPAPPTSQHQRAHQQNQPTQAMNQPNQRITPPQPSASPRGVQVQIPPTPSNAGAPSPKDSPNSSNSSPNQSQIGGGKWLTNIKNMVTPKANSALNVSTKPKDILTLVVLHSVSILFDALQQDAKKAQSVMMTKSVSSPDLPARSAASRNTHGVMLAARTPLAKDSPKVSFGGDRKILTRVYWRDGTYVTVDVTPGITAKEVCEFCTKKTKVAIFENLFCLYECLTDGSELNENSMTATTSELLSGWGEESENHLVCDLNFGTKNTVKTQLRKTLAIQQDDPYDSESDVDVDEFGQLDDLDCEPSEEDESIAMMIQEMIKLKHQLQEEDEMIERLAEEQEVDMLISRLANL